MDDKDVWFEPKRYGYGAGLPVRWQGWVLLGGFLAVVFALSAVARALHPAVFLAVVAVLTIAFVVMVAQHTRGGLRWRWGDDD